MLYTRFDTSKNIFGFALSYLNSDLNSVNVLQKLKKIIKCIQVNFSRLLNEDKTGEFNQIQFYSTKITPIERELARAVNLIQIFQF